MLMTLGASLLGAAASGLGTVASNIGPIASLIYDASKYGISTGKAIFNG